MARVHDPNVRKIVEQIAKHDREIKGLKNRKPGLGHSSIEDGTIHEYDAEGTLVSQHGKQPDGTHNIVVVNGPKPPKPTEGKVTALPGLIEIRWTGKFAGDAVSPLDLKHVGAYVVPSGDFLDLSDQAGVMTGELGDVLQVQADPGVYNVYLVAWSLAGKFSDAAGPVPVLVTVPADADAINDALDDINDRYDGVITEAGNLGNRLNQAEHELTEHETRLSENETDLSLLTEDVLPLLEQNLQDAKDALAPLPGMIESNETKINEAKTRLDTLDSTTLPGLANNLSDAQDRLEDAETAINTTLPGAIGDAQAAAEMALLIAPVSTAAPTLADGAGRPINAIWTRIDASGNEIGYWRWTASGWASMGLSTTVIPNLSAAKITSGTIATARLDAAAIAVAIASIIQLNADRITAGKIQASQIDVANLAAQIATVIELNASRITTGTLNADRLDANAVAAKIATVIQLNASRITAGTIATARLNTTEIAAQIATIINLNADRITAGTINVARLNVQAIAAATAAFQTVDIKNLFVTTGTMAEAVINKLWADVVMSRKITAQMLAIGAFDNLVPSPRFETSDQWVLVAGPAASAPRIQQSGGRNSGPRMAIPNDAANSTSSPSALYSDTFVAEEGSTYRLSAWWMTGFNSTAPIARLYVRFYSGGTYTSQLVAVGGSGSPNVWSVVRGEFTVPEGTEYIRVGGASSSTSVWVYFDSFAVNRMDAGELTVDGSMKARHIDVEDLAANSGFIADLTSRIIKSDVFQGKEFFGGVFIGSYFWTSPLPNVGLKLDEQGMRVYGPDGGEPVTEIRSDGGTVYSVSDPATGEVLAAIDPDGGIAGQSLSVVGDARLDGTVTIGGDPIPGHGTGESGPTILGRDLLGTTYVDYFEQHPQTAGAAWMTALPHGMVLNTQKSDPSLTWDAIGGQHHYKVRLGGTVETVAGRLYQVSYGTPAIRATDSLSGNLGEACIVRSAAGGSITAGGPEGNRIPASKEFISNAGEWTSVNRTTLLRCPDDIPEGKIMLGIELYVNSGRKASTTSSASAAVWSLSVMDMGLHYGEFNGTPLYLDKKGTEPPPPPPAPEPPKPKRFVDTVDATWWQAYTGTGAQATGSAYNGAAAQGRTPYYTANGVMRGLIGFPSQSSRLNGATVRKIEVYVYAKSWHAGAGGTAVIGTHGNTSKPGTWSRTTDDVARQKMKRAEGRWITLPSSVHAGFKSGALRGISFYPPSASTSTEYYGIFTGNKTRLRITYDK